MTKKIDLKSFICDAIKLGRKWAKEDGDNECLDRMASLFMAILENQGLEYKDGRLVEM